MSHQAAFPHPPEIQRLAQSWAFSVALHGLAVGLAVAVLGDLRLEPQPEPFTWEVSMVEPQVPAETVAAPPAAPAPRKAESAPSAPAPQPVKAQPVPPPPTVVASVAPPPMPVAPQRVVEPPPPAIEPPAPRKEIKAAEPPPPAKEARQEAKKEAEPPAPILPSKPVMTQSQPAVEVPKPAPERTMEPPAHSAPATSAAPAPPAPVSAPAPSPQQQHPQRPQHPMVASAAPTPAPAPVEAPPVSEPVKEPPPPAPAAAKEAPAPPPAPIQEASVRPPAPASVQAGPPAKADFGWVGKMLWDRVVTLKRYPNLARMQHLEGRVVVRAVIRDDGQLVEARITESSGSDILDQDAIEVLKRATPLKLHQPLGRPEVVVQVPITYKLQR